MRLKLLFALLLNASLAFAQVPAPQIPLTGTIGSGGIFPLNNAGTLIFSADANRTMVYPETSAYFIKLTSSVSLTATRNLVAPGTSSNIGFAYAVENATTGGQAVQVIGATGTGVTIANGQTATVYWDGTNYVNAFPPYVSTFASLTSGTNTQAAMMIDSGASLDFADSGTINASSINGVAVTGTPTTGQVLTATDSTDADWEDGGGGSMTWPSTPGVTVCTGTPCTAWGSSLTAPAGDLVGTTDTQTLTNKTVDGVTPTIFSYVDPTSSVQTQLNARPTGSGTSGNCVQWGASNTLGDAGAPCGSGGSSVEIQTNGTNNASQSLLNFTDTSTVKATNPSGGVQSFTVPTATATQLGVSSPDNSTLTATAGVYTVANTAINGTACTPGGSCTVTGAPSGSAGGDLGGSYPNPTVAQVNGAAVPASQGILGSDASGHLVAGTISAATLEAGIGYLPAPIAPLPDTTNLVGDYRFNETSGTTLIDYSGLNNNGTISNVTGLTRSGISYLMQGSAEVALPSSVNTVNSYHWLVQLPVATTGVAYGFNANQGYLMLNSLGFSNGLVVYTGGNVGNIVVNASPGMYGLESIGISNVVYMQAVDIIAGVHVISMVCPTGSGTGVFYLDGYVLTNVRTSTNCNNINVSGHLEFMTNTSGVGYYYYRSLLYSDVQSAATVLQVATALRSYGQSVGVPFAPVAYQSPNTYYFAAGDSITCGYGLSGCTGGSTSSLAYPALVPAMVTNTYTSQNFGIPAAQVQQQISTAPYTYEPLCNTASGQTIASLMEGTNNFQGTGSATAASVFQLNVAWGRLMKTGGCRFIFIAMISRTGMANNGTITYDTAKDNLNAQFRQNWVQSGANGFVDIGADPDLGCDGCYSNATYFQSDGIHPTAAGQTILADAVACVINGLDGSTPQLPNPTPITTSTYTTTCSDGGLITDASSNNIDITLKSALWQTGRIVQVCNNTLSGSNAVTLTAPSDFPFNNITGSTTLTLTNHSCQRFQAMYDGNNSAPGDYWQTIN